MVRLPAKITGLDIARFRETVNALIDCVTALRIIPDGKTINVSQSNFGTRVSVMQHGAAACDAAEPVQKPDTSYREMIGTSAIPVVEGTFVLYHKKRDTMISSSRVPVDSTASTLSSDYNGAGVALKTFVLNTATNLYEGVVQVADYYVARTNYTTSGVLAIENGRLIDIGKIKCGFPDTLVNPLNSGYRVLINFDNYVPIDPNKIEIKKVDGEYLAGLKYVGYYIYGDPVKKESAIAARQDGSVYLSLTANSSSSAVVQFVGTKSKTPIPTGLNCILIFNGDLSFVFDFERQTPTLYRMYEEE